MAYTRTPFKSYVRGLSVVSATSISTSGAISAGTTVSAGTQFLAPAGTVSAPGYAFTGRTDLGLYSAAAAQAYLASGSTATIGTASGRIAASAFLDIFSGLSQQSVHTPTQIAANTDDWAGISATATVARVSSDAARNLTGIVAPSGARTITLVNVGAFTITLKHDVTSTAANRFFGPGAADFALTQYSSATIRYDVTLTRWLIET